MLRDFSLTGIPTIDTYSYVGRPSRLMLGSTSVYTASMLGKLGADVYYSGVSGDDMEDHLYDALRASGVKIELIPRPGPMGRLWLDFDEDESFYRFGRFDGIGEEFSVSELPPTFWDAKAFWVGTCTPPFMLDIGERARALGREFYVNPQQQFKDNAALLFSLLPGLTGVYINLRELLEMRLGGAAEAIDDILSRKPGLRLSITRGPRGTWMIEAGRFYRIPGFSKPETSFMIGAGDTYAATYTYRRMLGYPVAECMQWSVTAATLKLRGFSYSGQPSEMELAAWLAEIRPHLPVEQVRWGGAEAEAWFRAEADIVEKR